MDRTALFDQVVDASNDSVVAHWFGDPLGMNGLAYFGENIVLDQGKCFVTQENAAMLGVRLQPRGQVHLTADDRVVHSVLAPEITNGGITCIDSNAELERLLQALIAPFRLQLSHAPLHRDRHVDAGGRILFDSPTLRITEERQDRVADVFVDGRAVRQSNLLHFCQIVIQQSGEFFRLQIIGRRGEVRDIRKEHGELLSIRGYFDLLRAREYR